MSVRHEGGEQGAQLGEPDQAQLEHRQEGRRVLAAPLLGAQGAVELVVERMGRFIPPRSVERDGAA